MVQTSVNHQATTPMVLAIGKLIVNFGAIEHETYVWLVCLGAAVENLGEAKLFKARVDSILRGVAQHKPIHAERSSLAWGEALELAKFRNRIAHSPIIFGWHSDDQSGAPDFIQVLDVKGGLNSADRQAIVNLEEINRHVNMAAKLAQLLRELRDTIW